MNINAVKMSLTNAASFLNFLWELFKTITMYKALREWAFRRQVGELFKALLESGEDSDTAMEQAIAKTELLLQMAAPEHMQDWLEQLNSEESIETNLEDENPEDDLDSDLTINPDGTSLKS